MSAIEEAREALRKRGFKSDDLEPVEGGFLFAGREWFIGWPQEPGRLWVGSLRALRLAYGESAFNFGTPPEPPVLPETADQPPIDRK